MVLFKFVVSFNLHAHALIPAFPRVPECDLCGDLSHHALAQTLADSRLPCVRVHVAADSLRPPSGEHMLDSMSYPMSDPPTYKSSDR